VIWEGDNRKFEIREYAREHSQLLVVSGREFGYDTRVEILFKSVAAIDLPSEFITRRITDEESEEVDVDRGSELTPIPEGLVAFRFIGGENDAIVGSVIARVAFTNVDEEGQYSTSGLSVWPMRSDPEVAAALGRAHREGWLRP